MVIKESKVKLNFKRRCQVLSINRSSYYKWLAKPLKKTDEFSENEIKRIYQQYKGTYGRDRITQVLRNSGIVINHKKVYRLMRKLGLKAIIRKKWHIRKYIKENVACNALDRNFKTDKPLSKLVCDVPCRELL